MFSAFVLHIYGICYVKFIMKIGLKLFCFNFVLCHVHTNAKDFKLIDLIFLKILVATDLHTFVS